MSAEKPETVLVTGASSGIGLELARCFAADGSRLVLVARNVPALEKLAEELRGEYKIEPAILPADLSLPDAPGNIFSELQGRGMDVDVLVNNAGFGARGRFSELPRERQLEMIRVNIVALTDLTALFLPGMVERHRGGVLNVASVAGFVPGPGMAVYYATKAFVLSFSEALAAELAGTGVKVMAHCPGPTDTNFFKAASFPDEQLARFGDVKMIRPAVMSARDVARHGHAAFRGGRVVAVSGASNRLLAFLPRLVPRALVRRIVSKFNGV